MGRRRHRRRDRRRGGRWGNRRRWGIGYGKIRKRERRWG
jgi:hypothetical protein